MSLPVSVLQLDSGARALGRVSDSHSCAREPIVCGDGTAVQVAVGQPSWTTNFEAS
jgi:hypothetical protein